MIAVLIASAVVSVSAPARAPATPAPVEEASVPLVPGRPDVPKCRRGRTECPYRSDANGDLDIPGLRESVYAGFEVAKSVPVLGGTISVDVQDARDFFATLPEQS